MEALLELKDITKIFPNVTALDSVNMTIYEHQIVGLIGENGAGKSTLMKVLAGVHKPNEGTIFLNGKELKIINTLEANENGICIVFQEQSLLGNLTIYENIFLGHESYFRKNGILSDKLMIEESKKELEKLGLNFGPKEIVDNLSIVQKKLIEIARNIWIARKSGVEKPIIILDEPTSVLEADEIEFLFSKLKELKETYSIIFISHRLHEVVSLCDMIYILKDGKNVGMYKRGEADEDILRSQMVGREFHGEYYLTDRQREPGQRVVLELQHWSKQGCFQDISFKLFEGEILCLSGTIGSGKEILCESIYGLTGVDSGTMFLNGEKTQLKNPQQAFKKGIGYLPEDRGNQGLILNMPIYDNTTLTNLRGIVDTKKQIETTNTLIDELSIKATSAADLCKILSGGNQQKVVFAKWIISNVNILVMSYPTRGVDVGAKKEIYSLIRDLAEKNISIIIIGDSFEEDIGLSNRIIALKDGRISGILDANKTKPTSAELIKYLV